MNSELNRLFWKLFIIAGVFIFLSSEILCTYIGQLMFGLSIATIIISLFYKIIWGF